MVIASIDTRPDPPALNPNGAQSKVFLFDTQVSAVSDPLNSFCLSNLNAVSLIAAADREPYRPCDSPVLTRVAADSSPPAVPSA